MTTLPPLPIVEHLPAICALLAENAPLILEAPPGTGKTTLLPLAVMDEPWLAGRRVVVLQPRRVAARAAAARMAEILGQRVGAAVGYRIRFESAMSSRTRVEVITEGLLTRMLQADPALENVGAVIFDEFHERSIHSDFALPLVREVRETLRPDLRIVVMSATLEASPVERLLAGAKHVAIEGRMHPVAIEYRPDCPRRMCGPWTVREVQQLLGREGGDILAFLPGKGDIDRAEAELADIAAAKGLLLCKLHGELPTAEQVRAILPDRQGRRKIVLSTPIAETSLTIEGVTDVVDSGFEKANRFDARSGLNRLVTQRISQDAAEQRAGRAGRTCPGRCIRLWSADTQRTLRSTRTPEILESDLSGLLLELALWGKRDPQELDWITAPPEPAVSQARELLARMGALDAEGRVTPLGRDLARLGTHPRLAAMLRHGAAYGIVPLACRVAALIEERDLVPAEHVRSADIEERLRLLERRGAQAADQSRRARVLKAAAGWEERLSRLRYDVRKDAPRLPTPAGFLLAAAYPERIAVRRGPAGIGEVRFLMAQGKGALLQAQDPLSQAEYIVIASLYDAPGDGRIHLAAELDKALFDGPLARLTATEDVVEWDEQRAAVAAVRRRRCNSLILDEQPLASPSEEQVRAAVFAALKKAGGIRALQWSNEAEHLKARTAAVRRWSAGSNLPDLSDEMLQASLETLLQPEWESLLRRAEWRRIDTDAVIRRQFTWQQRKALDRIAPDSLMLPNGKTRRVDYSGSEGAVLSATVQELFGWKETPRLGSGEIPLLLEVLSPARRPVQLTADLAGFWSRTYAEVRKELRGRYPKHKWPEDPLKG